MAGVLPGDWGFGPCRVLETTERLFFKAWELACYAGFLVGREAARYMLPRGRGTILFTGATASVRGGPGFAAFASAKFGLRAVAQSMARELGPSNIHVVHLLIDAGVDSPAIHERMRARGGHWGGGRAALCCDIAAKWLDLDDVGTLIGEEHSRERSRYDTRQIKDANTCKGTSHNQSP
jgi:NAD(P)-dependent dehydrogenase (short-subunit alcohol dehydrogenase family)